MKDIKTLFDYRKATFENLFTILNDADFDWIFPTNVFIDVNAMMHTFLKEDDVEYSSCHFSSMLLNFATYFRYFFYKQNSRINIYFYNDSTLLNDESDKRIIFLKEELSLLDNLCKIIPGVYHIESKEMPSRMIPFALIAPRENTLVVTYGNFGYLYPYYINKCNAYTLNLAGCHSRIISKYNQKWTVSPLDAFSLSSCQYAEEMFSGLKPIRNNMRLVNAIRYCNNHKDKKSCDYEIVKENEASIKQFNYNRSFFNVTELLDKNKDEFFSIKYSESLIDYKDKQGLYRIMKEYYSVCPFSIEQLFLGE